VTQYYTTTFPKQTAPGSISGMGVALPVMVLTMMVIIMIYLNINNSEAHVVVVWF